VADHERDSVQTDRLLLRPYTPEDLHAWHARIFADPRSCGTCPAANLSPVNS
jgi:hypothetical protein